MNLDDCTIYVFVRGDLPEEDQFIQGCHAVAKAIALSNPGHGHWRIVALDGGRYSLRRTMRKLSEKDISYYDYSDPDKPDWGVTALATAPLTAEQGLPLANYRLRRYSPGVPLTTESLASMPSGEPNAAVAQDRALDINREVAG